MDWGADSLKRPRAWTHVIGSPRVAAAACAAATLIAAGLWISFSYCRAAWGPDSDVSTTIALWRGMRDHGPGFVSTWSYTQDNWLLSLIPISSAVFAVFGTTAEAALLPGWGFFLGSIALAAWVTSRLAGARATIALTCVLLFASFPALGAGGFLGYPISHGVSMTWGLAALALALLAIERGRHPASLASAAAVFINTVSDPWAGAAIALPIIVASAALAVLRRERREAAGGLAVACLVSLVVARTRLFGALWFLPAGGLNLTDFGGFLVNLHWGYRALAVLFNIVPGGGVGQFAVRLVDAGAFVLVLGWATVSSALGLRRASAGRQFVEAVAILSIGAVFLLFLVGRWEDGPGVARFFPNIYFLGAILTATQASAAWSSLGRARRTALIAYGALLVVSGAASRPAAWSGREPAADAADARGLGVYLASRGLAYGYGPYWGAQALAMETLTSGRVTVRPVTFANGRVARRPNGASSLWFTPSAEPADRSSCMVIASDGEECAGPAAYERIALRQFGPPARRLVYRNAVILVWDHPLVGRIAG